MQVTSKGQVTIPIAIRQFLGIFAHTEVQFELIPEGALLTKATHKESRGNRVVNRLKGRGDISMSTDEIMALTRGDS